MQKYFVYEVQPIDFPIGEMGFYDLVNQAMKNREFDMLSTKSEEREYMSMIAYGMHYAAKNLRWDGDIRGQEYGFFSFPDGEIGFVTGFYWKQDNNGGSFVVSPIELKHLNTGE